jgi:hypothetical protein
MHNFSQLKHAIAYYEHNIFGQIFSLKYIQEK